MEFLKEEYMKLKYPEQETPTEEPIENKETLD